MYSYFLRSALNYFLPRKLLKFWNLMDFILFLKEEVTENIEIEKGQ